MKFSAHFIVPADGSLLPKAIVEVDASGTIVRLIETSTELREQAGMEFHSGLICPAFINLWQLANTDEMMRRLPELEAFRSFIPQDTSHPKAIFNWIKAIQENVADSSLTALIGLFTARAAQAFNVDDAGLIATGKRPGLILISGIDYANFKLKADSRLKKLI
ncbi:hypothetical protein [Mangrovibacterium marinum]|uniref:Amidohydrolase family protein n=1 Tax=Mangrovibacterium marinum TaxID=1639118 RepID=A0A2T5C2P1_9BACT|nr:hypothetical protein [Mangrovibacterium marinum]PTN09023.1 hypothetical protein C8N47_106122 [Mangrovibacterium marinum]